jgi:hypothetical protein
MAPKKKGLPETTVTKEINPGIIGLAKRALRLRSVISNLTAEMDQKKEALVNECATVRKAEEAKGEYIGLIRITDPDITPCQIQYKMTGGALALEEGETLDRLFGAGRPMLFEKDVVVTGCIDPDALIAEMRAQGKNPWDFLEIHVKKDMDKIVATSAHVTKEEAYLPKKDFLATLNDIKHTLVAEAKEYINKYLAQVLKPTVDLGKK